MMKKLYWLPVLLLICGMGFVSCNFNNNADILAAEDALSIPQEILDSRVQQKTDFMALVQSSLDTIKATRDATLNSLSSQIVKTTVRPSIATACCWAHSVLTSLNDYDQSQNWVNTYGDQCPPSAAIDNSTSTWWNMNYMRVDNAIWPHKKHTEIPIEERIDEGNHWLTVELDNSAFIVGITYMGRNGNNNSHIEDYQIFVSDQSLGHYCPPDSFVYQGVFANNQVTQEVDFGQPIFGVAEAKLGKFVEVRVLDTWASGPDDGGIDELRVITADQNAFEGLIGQANDAINTANTAMAEVINDTLVTNPLVVDYSQLENCFKQGVVVLGKVKNNPIKYNRLYELMYGKLDTDGTVLVKGATQYLDNDPDRITTFGSDTDLNAFFQYQDNVDSMTAKLGSVISVLQTPGN